MNDETLPGGRRFSLNEAAGFLGISANTLRLWRQNYRGTSPKIPAYKIGKKIVYHEADLEAFLSDHRDVKGQ